MQNGGRITCALPEEPCDMNDPTDALASDVLAISRMDAVPALLKFLCHNTGMGFAAVARVTDEAWIACAVEDNIQFGLQPGNSLDVNTTLCKEVRALRQPIAIDQASTDPDFRRHPATLLYRIESYISVPIVRRDGAYFGNLCAVDSHPRKVSDPQTLATFATFADLIAMLLDSGDQLQASNQARLDEKATSDLREQFIAVLGHDLRNPLSAVSSTAELLVRRPESEVVRLGERLKTTSRRMAKLIDDVMDFARGRLGTGIGVTLESQTNMAGAFLEVIDELRQVHPHREVQADLQIPKPLECDRGRLQQLLSNLIGNALTYGAADVPVVISATLSDSFLVLTVTNGGEPIKPGNLPLVFQPYWRPHTSKPGGGLGLGLYICTQIAKAHGGEMEVASSTLIGTVFGTRLPIVLDSTLHA